MRDESQRECTAVGAPGDLGGEDGTDLIGRVPAAAQLPRGECGLVVEAALPNDELVHVAVGVEPLLANPGGGPVGEIVLGEVGDRWRTSAASRAHSPALANAAAYFSNEARLWILPVERLPAMPAEIGGSGSGGYLGY